MSDYLEAFETYAVFSAVILALIGYVVKYLHDLTLTRRNDRLARVNEQLKRLYGPLYALSCATRIAWKSFRSKHRPGGAFFRKDDPPSEEDLVAWRYGLDFDRVAV